jgi:hypothetical protein
MIQNGTVPLRFDDEARMVDGVFEAYVKELVMPGFKRFVSLAAVAAMLACAPMLPAVAGGHGFGHFHGWGLGRGLVGAVVGLATLPLVIASAAIAASVPDPGYASGAVDGPRGYAPAPGVYAAPAYAAPPYYAPPPAYYPRPPVYYPTRTYYAPRGYAAPRAYSAPASGRSYYGGYGSYRSGGYAYPHR